MSRGPSNFKQRDLRCALAATKQAGIDVARIEIDKGKIIIVPGKPEPQADTETNDEKRKARYKETEHVKTFYRVNRYPS